VIRTLIVIGAALSLAVCLAAPAFYFLGGVSAPAYKNTLLAGTFGWFVCAALLAARRKSG